MTRHVFAAVAAIATLLAPGGAVRAQDPPRPQEQRPVFRAGAHFVRVDAYPTRDGRPVRGLTAADFEILEDGKPQAIELVEYVEYEGWTPNAVRSDPNSQREAFEAAADPRNRVFVLYLDAYHVTFDGSHRLRLPIAQLLNRMLGPADLVGVLTPRQRPRVDLILGRQSLAIEEQLTRHPDWGLADRENELEPGEIEILAALGDRRGYPVVALRRLDKVYADLEELVTLLGDLRQERKNILFFSDSLPSPPTLASTQAIGPGSRPPMPRIGVSDKGKLTTGSRNSAEPDRQRVEQEEARLRSIDFSRRFRDLLRQARQANVAVYPVSPGGAGAFDMMSDGGGNLLTLADQSDGLAVTGTNDLRNGLKRVAEDLASHYVLGYYTSNTNWNGASRRIAVKLTSTGESVRARREYRAPTADDMASLRAAVSAAPAGPTAEAVALGALARSRPGARLHAYGRAAGAELAVVAELSAAEIEAGRWKQGAEVLVMAAARDGDTAVGKGRIDPGARGTVVAMTVGANAGPWDVEVRVRGEREAPESAGVTVGRATADRLLGEPIAYRAAAAASAAFRPIAVFQFRRTERVRVEWPILGTIDSEDVRLLDRNGRPLEVPVQVARGADGKSIAATLNLAPLSNGDYLIEMTARSGSAVERTLLAIRVALAR